MSFLDGLFGSKNKTVTTTPTYAPQFQALADLLGGISPGLVQRPFIPYLGQRRPMMSPLQQMAIGRAYEAGTASDAPVWSPMGRRTSYQGQSGYSPVPQSNFSRGGLAQMRRY